MAFSDEEVDAPMFPRVSTTSPISSGAAWPNGNRFRSRQVTKNIRSISCRRGIRPLASTLGERMVYESWSPGVGENDNVRRNCMARRA